MTPNSAQSVTPSHSSRSDWRRHIVVLLAYLLLAILLTWPTITQLAIHLPGDGGDDPAIAWNLWWVKHALLTLETNLLHSDYMFFPIGINLAYYTLTTLNGLTALPLTLNLGVVFASNIHMYLTFVIGGYGVFLLCRQALGSRCSQSNSFWAAALAGAFYAFASSQIFYISLGQFNIASSHWLPFVVLFTLRSRNDLRSLRPVFLTALFLIMQAWAEMTYASFGLIFIAIFVVYEGFTSLVSAHPGQRPDPVQVPNTGHVAENKTTVSRSRLACYLLALRNLVILAGLFTIGIVPLLTAMLPDMRVEGDFWVQGTGFAEVFSADLLGFLIPTMNHPFFGELVGQTGIVNFDKGQHLYPGYVLLVLAMVGLIWSLVRHKTRYLFWLLAALFFAWLSLGPSIHVNGTSTGIPGPFQLLQSLPFFKGNRYPSRYSVMLILCLVVPAAEGLHLIFDRLTREGRRRRPVRLAAYGVGSALLALFVFEHLAVPLPQSNMKVPAPYYSLAEVAPAARQGPSANALLDIPIAWRNGFRITGPIHPGFMFGQFYQTVHQRPLLQGNTSRNPEFKFQYFTQAPVINSILALETGHQLPPAQIEQDRILAGEVLRFFDIGDIVVRAGPANNPSITPQNTIPYIESVLPAQETYADPAMVVYRVDLPPIPDSVRISTQAPLIDLYLGEGWGGVTDIAAAPEGSLIWAQRNRTRLFVLLQPAAQQMSMRMLSPGPGQQLKISVGSWQSDPISLTDGWGEYSLELPKEMVQEGLNEVIFEFKQLYPVIETHDPAPALPFSSLVVTSAGQEIGDFAHIYLDGRDLSPNKRGYNIAVIAPSGDIQTAAFDTHLDPDASRALTAFIGDIPEGHTVAVAVADEASMQLGEDAVAALNSLGLEGDLRGKFRWSQAAIGGKGTAPGTAIEMMDEIHPARVSVGPVVTEPYVAAGVEWIKFETQ